MGPDFKIARIYYLKLFIFNNKKIWEEIEKLRRKIKYGSYTENNKLNYVQRIKCIMTKSQQIDNINRDILIIVIIITVAAIIIKGPNWNSSIEKCDGRKKET